MEKGEKLSEPLLSRRSELKSIKEEINFRHQHDSDPDKVDGTTANEVESETVHVIHSVPKLQDSTDKVPTHGTDIELTPSFGHSPKINSDDNINLTMVISDENIHTGKPVLESSDDDDEKVCTNTGKKQPRIIHPSEKTLHNNETGNMAQKGLTRIFSRKD